MLRYVAEWELRRVLSTGGRGGLSMLLLFPLLFLVPWQRFSFFEDTAQAALILSVVYAFIAATFIGADAGKPRQAAFWLFQKGISQSDYALAAWSATLIIGFCFLVFGAVLNGVGLTLNGHWNAAFVGTSLAVATGLFLIAHATLLALTAFRVDRKTEILLLLVMAASLQPLLLAGAPSVAVRIAHVLLPPISDTFALVTAARNARWGSAVGLSLHLSLYLSVLVTASYALQRSWTPAKLKA